MKVEVKSVLTHTDLKTFIYLPSKIHRNHKNWVPPIYMDEWEYFNAKKNRAFTYCDVEMFLAFRGKEAVGRIMGVINRQYNELHNENHARFANIETYNDFEVFAALMEAVEKWAREKGTQCLVGPLAFSDKDPQGFLIEGFDEPVTISSNCNFPYMPELTEKCGYHKKVDLVDYQIPIPKALSPFYQKITDRFLSRNTKLKILEFTSRRKVKPYIYPVLELVNITYTCIYGSVPYSRKEMDEVANRFLYLIDPRYIKIIVNENDDVLAFGLGMSDISKGLQKSKGKLLPFGWIHLLIEARKSKQLNLLLGGIHPDYQGRGFDVLVFNKMMKSAVATGKETFDSHLILENNTKMRAEMERIGGKVYKRFRIFVKEL